MRIGEQVSRNDKRAGFTLIATAISILALLGATGLAVDLGRMYIAKNEVQAFADAAALSAAQMLDGTNAGVVAARNAAAAAPVRWNLARNVVANPTVEFSPEPPVGSTTYTWTANPNPPANYTMVRVTANVEVAMYFLSALTRDQTGSVGAGAIAGQVRKTSFKQGLFPFSPFAQLFAINAPGHAPWCGTTVTSGCMDPVTGLIIGQEYTLRWPSNPQLGNAQGNGSNMCTGDRLAGQVMVDMANQAGGSERGFIEDTSSSAIRQTIVDDYQTVTRTVGDLVTMTGGAKQTQLSALYERIGQDVNQTDMTRDGYYSNPHNGRRIVACLINDGVLVGSNQYRAIQIGAFLLKNTGLYGNGGNQGWCGIYLGPFCQGCRSAPGGSGGAFVIRLVE